MLTGPPHGPRAFDERLVVPWWWWPGGVGVAVLLAAVVHGGAGGARAVVPYAVAVPLALLCLARASRGRVRVSEGVLHVPGARVPVALVDRALPLDPPSLRRLAGPQRHPWAHLARKGFVATAVLVELDDPADDTPYWVVSTRRPDELVDALAPRPTSPATSSG